MKIIPKNLAKKKKIENYAKEVSKIYPAIIMIMKETKGTEQAT